MEMLVRPKPSKNQTEVCLFAGAPHTSIPLATGLCSCRAAFFALGHERRDSFMDGLLKYKALGTYYVHFAFRHGCTTACPNHLLLALLGKSHPTKQGWFQGHRFRARLSNAMPGACLKRACKSSDRENPAGCFSGHCVPTQQNPSTSHQQSTRNTTRTWKNEVEPVKSYGAVEWLLNIPGHDIHMISWSVPGFSPHWCITHQDLKKSPMITSPASPGPALPSLLWSRCPDPEQGRVDMQYPEAEAPTPSTCRRLRDRSCSEIVGYQTASKWSLKNWQKMATWPWNSAFTENHALNVALNRSSP